MTTNIAIASISPTSRELWRHLKSRQQFEEHFPYSCVGIYDEKESTYPDDETINLQNDLRDFVEADNVDIIIDTHNSVSLSYDVCSSALNAGKHVVTTNAAMVAIHGEKLNKVATAHNVHFKFSAAILGGVPILQALQNGAENWYISRIHGILNSTCNYVLNRMKERHVDQKEALDAAIELGYAHANPDLDINGKDTLYKLALLSATSYGRWPILKDAQVVPLDNVDLQDIQLANKLGFDICHMGIATTDALKVGPTLVEQHTLLGQMNGTLTGVVVDGDQVGSIFMAGYGADAQAITASIMSDLSDITHTQVKVRKKPKANKRQHNEHQKPRFYVRLPEENTYLLKANKSIDIIEEAITQNSKNKTSLGFVVETHQTKQQIETVLHSVQDNCVVLDIFRE